MATPRHLLPFHAISAMPSQLCKLKLLQDSWMDHHLVALPDPQLINWWPCIAVCLHFTQFWPCQVNFVVWSCCNAAEWIIAWQLLQYFNWWIPTHNLWDFFQENNVSRNSQNRHNYTKIVITLRSEQNFVISQKKCDRHKKICDHHKKFHYCRFPARIHSTDVQQRTTLQQQ